MDAEKTIRPSGQCEPETAPPSGEGTLAARQSGTLVALFAIGFFAFLNLYTTQPLLPQFRHFFMASELLVSFTVSAPVLAVTLTAFMIGLVADAVGRKRVIIAAVFGLSLPTILAGTSANLGQLVMWRFWQGLFIAGITSVTIAYISEESPSKSLGSIMATYVTGTVVGGFVGRFSAGFISARYGWRISFIVLGVATMAGAIAAWSLLPRSTKFIRHRNIVQALKPMWGHLKNPPLLATYATGFNVLFCLVGTFTYVNFYLADKPFLLGPTALALIFVVYLVGVVITPLAGRFMDRVGQRKVLMGAAGMSATGMAMTLIHSLPLIIAGLALVASGVFACHSASASHVGKAAREARSSAAGLYISFYYLGGFAGSVIPGILWKYAGWRGCVAIMIFMQLIAILIANRWWQR